ncbi:DMT family transporter [Pannonibacter sp. SL95]|jgi:drug/metabolite transporter (DMT)-like permease|uniref:DMT family transporter n=1 Tax=Pannonibacter sp. SL95 TaxID=2995153 RepID=UPI002272409C|nr:DMT family transporter [Pannonibacter sp. SL95]MCY1708557.1 DMT family transporter [Pannonibacter sp. SL95]
MTSLGLALVLAAAFCHATWNVLVKRVGGGPELVWLFSVLSVILYLPVALWVILVERPYFGPWQILFICGSTLVHMAYFLFLQVGYRKGDLSLVYPTARATGPLLSTAFAVVLLGEQVSLQMAAGALVMVTGVAFLTSGGRRDRAAVTTSLLFGLGTGVLIGIYTAWDAYSVSVLLIPPLLLDYVSSFGRSILLSPLALKRRELIVQHWRNHRLSLLAIAFFNPLAYILVLYALTFTPVAFVAPIRELSVPLTVLAGSLLLGEGHLKHRLGWSVVILAGLLLLIAA